MTRDQSPVFKSLRSKKNGVLEHLLIGHFTPYETSNTDIFTETYLSRFAFPNHEVSITIIQSLSVIIDIRTVYFLLPIIVVELDVSSATWFILLSILLPRL